MLQMVALLLGHFSVKGFALLMDTGMLGYVEDFVLQICVLFLGHLSVEGFSLSMDMGASEYAEGSAPQIGELLQGGFPSVEVLG